MVKVLIVAAVLAAIGLGVAVLASSLRRLRRARGTQVMTLTAGR